MVSSRYREVPFENNIKNNMKVTNNSRFANSHKNDSTGFITQTPSVLNPNTQVQTQREELTTAEYLKGKHLLENMRT
jgi:hypothetical protein